jgi:hypothetical protein
MSTDVAPLSPENSQTRPQPVVRAAVKADVVQPSPRLRLWQVLREEYLLFHPQPPPPGSTDKPLELDLDPDFWQLKGEQLDYTKLAISICRQENEVAKSLFGILGTQKCDQLREFDGDQPLSVELWEPILNALNNLLRDKDFQTLHSQTPQSKETLKYVSDESEPGVEYPEIKAKFPDYKRQLVDRWFLEENFPEGIVSIDESLTAKYYQAIHKVDHAALCLSGGGIRSATFNLGILQGLARHGLLEEFDYLSTVSGGGFSGGWLSAWIKRHPDGLDGVMRELGRGEDETTPEQNLATPPAQKPRPRLMQKPLEPEPKALSWLRSYSNFLSPKLGLFTADTWTLVATLLRNVFLNWLVFVPVLMAALMLPRLWLAFVARGRFEGANSLYYVAVAFVAGMIALLYIGLNLPSTRKLNRGQGDFLKRCLVPLIISSIMLATYGMRAAEHHVTLPFSYFWYYQAAIIFIPWLVCAFYQSRIRSKASSSVNLFLHFAVATLLILVAQTITAWLMWRLATIWADMNTAPGIVIFYACFAVPIILGLLSFTGLMLAGLTSNYTEDDDQEWWARAGAWVFIAMIGWSVISVLVLYAPQLLINFPRQLAQGKIFSKEVLTTVGGIVSGAIALYGGFNSKAPATDQEAKKSGFTGTLVQLLINVAALVFLVFIIVVLALLTNTLLVLLFKGPWLAGAGTTTGSYPHSFIIQHSPFWLLVVMLFLLAFLGFLFGRFIKTNRFSLHYLWRNRIIRAYLGASNPNRQPNLFTGFDQNDNLQMHELKPTGEKKKKLLHVLNFALNLVAGEKLAWQERRAESFTASPLHCGNYLLGYRKSESYGRRLKSGDDKKRSGISLGTSIALSGAFVSPNMGYMQTSPVIRFLMTLFNVRFGWWLGNPGRAGDNESPKLRTYDLDSPRLSVKPIAQEALGMTDDQADYVYLSDGGHFENFGLYEMVLRRCRLIVIGDATSDAEYAFESLGQSLRKIRIDFGIPIEFTKFSITKPSRDGKGVYAAIGTIKYHCIDGKDTADGTVILIKPTLVGSETRDVLNYASQSGSFPQEFIGDQWFSESQFESYRALGSHIVDSLCKEPVPNAKIEDRNILTLDAFKKRVEENLDLELESDFGQQALDYLRKNIP